MAAKNNISLGLIDGNSIGENEKPNVELLNEMVKEGLVSDTVIKPALLISVVDYPVTISYGSHKIRLSGRAREKVADYSKLGNLPSGITVKKL